jgi:NADPH:quinone reductase
LSSARVPEVGRGQVRVRIAVSGVNPTDWKARQGSASGIQLPTPQVPNQDGAGIVDAIGAEVSAVAVGQRVWVWQAAWQRADGTAQEYVVLPERQVVPLPDKASFDVGASVGIPALTAHLALTTSDSGPSRLNPGALAGRTGLVTGGAGAVGHAAIQLAGWAGAAVITTVSGEEKAELARRAGADHVINFREEDVAARVDAVAPHGVDMIVDVNANANIAIDMRVVATGGTVAIYAGDERDAVTIPIRPSMTKNIRFQFILTYTTTAEQKQNGVTGVADAIADGAFAVGADAGLPITRFPLADTAQAHRAVEEGAIGKVLVDVAANY